MAFTIMYDRYSTAIFSFIRGMKVDEAVAIELVQDTFIKVINRIELFDEQKKFKTWLWTIARNTVIDYWRKKDAMLFTNPIDESSNIDELSIEYTDAELILLDHHVRADIMQCLEQLPLEKRDVLLLRLFSELSYQDIATASGFSLGKVKTIIRRAKIQLRKCLVELGVGK